MSISARVTSLMLIIFLAVSAGIGLAYRQVRNMRLDARVVNHAGIVRGATQRLVKLELSGQPNDGLIDKLDALVEGLIVGDEGLVLPPAEDPAFLGKMSAVQKTWEELKATLLSARADESLQPRLMALSEEYFGKTNEAVFAAEEFSNKKVGQFLVGLLAVTGAIAVVIVLAWRTMQARVARPIRRISQALEKITTGDLTIELSGAGKDEIGLLIRSVNSMVATTRAVITETNNASLELASVAEELSASINHIATSNEQVASQSQTVAAAAEEMSATVEEAARNTVDVNGASERARTVASEGAGVVSQTVEAVQEIASVVEQAAATVRELGSESEKIGVVVQVIEDIADQTNLLALNAAIEAARAGEHGRGFAVVADEVRKLAEKTVKATQEISQTIFAIQTESRRVVGAIDQGMETVATGRELGEKAGSAIRDIEDQVVRATEQTRQIATATEELAATSREMASNLDEILRGVQQNSRSAVEVSSTAGALATKAEELKELTGRFQTV